MRYLVLGSLNIDMIYHVDHIVDPGETISAVHMEKSAGGKGANQAASLAKAGADTFFAGKIGQDGIWILDKLASYGVNVSKTIISNEHETGTAAIQVDKNGQNSIIVNAGGNKAFQIFDVEHILDGFGENDVLIVENEINLVGEIMEKAKERGMLIVFNPSPFSEDIFSYPLKLVDFFFLNEIEAELLSGIGRNLSCDADFREALEMLSRMYSDSKIIVTAGKKGAYSTDSGGVCYTPIIDLPVKDTTGAGDTFLGYFLFSILSGRSTLASLERATLASSIAVTRDGAMESIPFYPDVDNYFIV